VLLEGESARARSCLAAHIHARKPVRGGAVRQSEAGAADSDELIESELFGTKGRVHRARRRRGAESSSWPTAARCFLTEVGDLHGASQAKLLRVLQEGEFHRVAGAVDSRVGAVICGDQSATERAGDASRNSARICTIDCAWCRCGCPRLREAFAKSRRPARRIFLAEFCARIISSRKVRGWTFEALEDYGWPGNIREFGNA